MCAHTWWAAAHKPEPCSSSSSSGKQTHALIHHQPEQRQRQQQRLCSAATHHRVRILSLQAVSRPAAFGSLDLSGWMCPRGPSLPAAKADSGCDSSTEGVQQQLVSHGVQPPAKPSCQDHCYKRGTESMSAVHPSCHSIAGETVLRDWNASCGASAWLGGLLQSGESCQCVLQGFPGGMHWCCQDPL